MLGPKSISGLRSKRLPSVLSLCVQPRRARVRRVQHHLLPSSVQPRTDSRFLSAAPPRSSITTGAMKEEKMHVGYWKAVSTRGAGISDSTALCRAAQTA